MEKVTILSLFSVIAVSKPISKIHAKLSGNTYVEVGSGWQLTLKWFRKKKDSLNYISQGFVSLWCVCVCVCVCVGTVGKSWAFPCMYTLLCMSHNLTELSVSLPEKWVNNMYFTK